MNYEPCQLPKVDAIEVVVLGGSKYREDAPYVRVEGETAQQIAHLWRQLPPDELQALPRSAVRVTFLYG